MSGAGYGTKRSHLELLQEFSIPLILGVVVAMCWANLEPAAYDRLMHASPFGEDSHVSFQFLMNDILMALFFGLAAKEITESCLPGGALNPPSKAMNPLIGTLGGVLGPVAVYFLWVALTNDPSIGHGWGIPTATDIALAWLVARIVFGKGHPAVQFLLLLAVVDDGIGLGIIAVFYPDSEHPVEPAWLLLVGAAIGMAFALRRANVRSFWPYVLTAGVASWSGLFLAHLHPALALVPVVPFMPNMGCDEGLYAEESSNITHTDTMNNFEHFFRTPVDFGLFGFGLANAGVALASVGNATAAVLVSLVVGKTVGIFLFSWVGHTLGFKLPDGMNFRALFVAGLTAALGLTVALFVAGQAFEGAGDTLAAAKMGALLSILVAPIAVTLGLMLRVKAPKTASGALSS